MFITKSMSTDLLMDPPGCTTALHSYAIYKQSESQEKASDAITEPFQIKPISFLAFIPYL